MDGISVTASVVSIASAGAQLSITLVTLGTQVKTASERIMSVSNDISVTSSVLHQLGDLMSQNNSRSETSTNIFSRSGLETTRASALCCKRIFEQIKNQARRASVQLRSRKRPRRDRIELTMMEKAKWPFFQPKMHSLREDLKEAKGTLMLMLQVSSLALSKRTADEYVSCTDMINNRE